jgi:hypothetical protein
MKLADLQQAVRAADPAAILVSPPVLHRVIQQECKLPTLLLHVPHRKSYVVDRHVLFRHIEQDELDLEPDRLLPSTVVLLSEPPAEQLATAKRDAMLLEYWRRLFHAKVHLTLEQQLREGKLTPEAIRERIEQIGATEFAEVRLVLGQDHMLLPPATDERVYVEFAAVFLELRFFAANLLPIYFPGIGDFEKVYLLLAHDLDPFDLFARTRLAGAPDPVVRTDTRSDESNDYYLKLIRTAEREGRAGNNVRAAIIRTRAARVAPASLTFSTRVGAEEELQHLTVRLQAALYLSDDEVKEWLKDLPALLEKADQGSRPVEAALLFDLQTVCLDHEGEVYSLDMVEWLLSAGRRPIKRPLPSQRLVRITKHLRSAAQRLTMARLSDDDRLHLARLLQAALDRAEERLRDRIRPILTDALLDVGLQPRNPPEHTAFLKVIEELLDRITEFGFLTFGDLRDAISRNQLKLPDLPDPQEFVRGDPLLRLDRRLAILLDGVYRPSEFYLRWLERFTALNFGTDAGRAVTLWVTAPFGGALLASLALNVILELFGGPEIRWSVHALIVMVLGTFFLGLIHHEPFRRRCKTLAVRTGRAAHKVFIELPMRVMRIPLLRSVVSSWPFQLVYWYLVKPALAGGLVLWLVPSARTVFGAVTTFFAVNFVLNSRVGRAVNETLAQSVVAMYELFREGLIPGLIRFFIQLFKQIIDMVQYVLFTVDEWLRFRSGEGQLALAVRTVLGLLWFPVAYLVRFYLVVLIEPWLNPVKAPISYLAAKLIYPFLTTLGSPALGALEPWVGRVAAWVIVWPTLFLLPDAFGFLFWELKENWRLYRANRRSTLRPVLVGPHGETVRQLLQPGVHSGTVPRLFARLRYTEREALKTGNWRAARLCRQSLEETVRTFRRLVAREALTLLRQSPSWHGVSLQVDRVDLASNRVRIALAHEGFPGHPVWVDVEIQTGWLVAGISDPGWLGQLLPDQQRSIVTALTGLYKLMGIDFVREQIQANLPPGVACYDLTATQLILWLDHRHGRAVAYDLHILNGQLRPRTLEGMPTTAGRVLEVSQLVFGQIPLPWERWVENWQEDQVGKMPLSVFPAEVKLLPAAPPALALRDGPATGAAE